MSECEVYFTHDTKKGIKYSSYRSECNLVSYQIFQDQKGQEFHSNSACFFSSISFSHNSLALPMSAMRYPVVMSPDLDSYTPSA